MLWLIVAPSAPSNVGRALSEHPEVHFAAAVTGRDGLVASVGSPSTGDLHTYLSEETRERLSTRAPEQYVKCW
ncbi:hypothetical protein [Streptomyces sp. SID12488]|uniref:hypothetical protein n=1 Tax=Streptomyces sp. SID12488 TaxID=2706040 RepID=UPI0013D9C866|nr:hypothetical protein [Streptomyces sp. SID12488]NEA65778.1 hypothetical protein [Streptomyces sp. SID12488]